MNGCSDTGVGCVCVPPSSRLPHQMQRLPRAVCHKDVRAVNDSAIVLRADRVETLDAEPTALGPETVRKNGAVSVFAVGGKTDIFLPFHSINRLSLSLSRLHQLKNSFPPPKNCPRVIIT